jgi:hypothetical protein
VLILDTPNPKVGMPNLSSATKSNISFGQTLAYHLGELLLSLESSKKIEEKGHHKGKREGMRYFLQRRHVNFWSRGLRYEKW